jgi:iron complex outermembrane receptor protein
LSGNISLTHADRQKRISGANETDTGSHNLLNADISYTLATRVGLGKPTLFLRGTNLLNDDVRRSTSFIKDVAPAPGRGAVMGVRINF